MEEGRFPSTRSVHDAADPARALEEERRLAYVAWTRARRTLTLLYDPLVPSRSCSRRSAQASCTFRSRYDGPCQGAHVQIRAAGACSRRPTRQSEPSPIEGTCTDTLCPG